ncbi:hypothetical protein [Dyella silvatica]|uniref:hypothetical protein n=1 Tax=Dyella silvatica TaxID=2992128 RepID=UPI00225376F5|nr:hypothetical protein [Dyella silvatica]
MNGEPLFAVALLLALVASVVISAGLLCRRGLAIGYATLIEGVSAGEPRLREIERLDVYLFCLDDLLPSGKHSLQRRFIVQ